MRDACSPEREISTLYLTLTPVATTAFLRSSIRRHGSSRTVSARRYAQTSSRRWAAVAGLWKLTRRSLAGAPKQPHGGGAQSYKNTVLTLVERGGRARSFHIASTTVGQIVPVVNANIAHEATLMTDEARHYVAVGQTFAGSRRGEPWPQGIRARQRPHEHGAGSTPASEHQMTVGYHRRGEPQTPCCVPVSPCGED